MIALIDFNSWTNSFCLQQPVKLPDCLLKAMAHLRTILQYEHPKTLLCEGDSTRASSSSDCP